MHDLYSVGYLNPVALDLLQAHVQRGAILVDIRLVAGSRYRPEFSAKRLRERFGMSYQRIRSLGNEHYNQPEAPIVLRDPGRGYSSVVGPACAAGCVFALPVPTACALPYRSGVCGTPVHLPGYATAPIGRRGGMVLWFLTPGKRSHRERHKR